MTLVRLVTIGLRLYAATLAVTLALTITNLLSTVRLLYGAPDALYRVQLASVIGQIIGLSILIGLLISKSEAAARLVVGVDEPVRVPGARHVATIAFAVVGVNFLVEGLQGAIGQWAMWKFVPVDEFTGQRFVAPNINPERIANVAVLITVGTGLFFGARSVSRLVLWLRRAPAQSVDDTVEE